MQTQGYGVLKICWILLNYLCRAPLLQSEGPQNTSRWRAPTKFNTNLFSFFFCFVSPGLQTDFEVPWDSAATQWVCGDRSGSHLFTAGREISPWCCPVENSHCRSPNKPFMNRDFTEFSMCGMSFITLVAMAAVRWDTKLFSVLWKHYL